MPGDATARTIERVSRTQAARLASSLGLPTDSVSSMNTLPAGWHLAFCLSIPPKYELADDGLPLADPLLPHMDDYPVRVMGGTSMEIVGEIPMESELACNSRIASVIDKVGRSGPLRIAMVHREYSVDRSPVAVEQQEIVYLKVASKGTQKAGAVALDVAAPDRVVHVDEIDVFRFSAVTFNSHRVHYDRPYTLSQEG